MLLPPFMLIAASVVLHMMDSAKGDSKLIGYFERDAPRLRVADVMRLRRHAAANETRLPRHKAKVRFRADAPKLTETQL